MVIWLSLVMLSIKVFVGNYVADTPACHSEGFGEAVRENMCVVRRHIRGCFLF